jgi:hypothetical protein
MSSVATILYYTPPSPLASPVLFTATKQLSNLYIDKGVKWDWIYLTILYTDDKRQPVYYHHENESETWIYKKYSRDLIYQFLGDQDV